MQGLPTTAEKNSATIVNRRRPCTAYRCAQTVDIGCWFCGQCWKKIVPALRGLIHDANRHGLREAHRALLDVARDELLRIAA